MAERHPILEQARPGQFVGVELCCPRYDCDWREKYGSAVVVNEYGVRDPLPDRCKKCGLPVKVERIVEIVDDLPKNWPDPLPDAVSSSP